MKISNDIITLCHLDSRCRAHMCRSDLSAHVCNSLCVALPCARAALLED